MATLKIGLYLACFFYSQLIAICELDQCIAPEIYKDAFYEDIYQLCSKENIHTILEIGSSSGEGSTAAFATGILKNPNRPILYCLELSKPRFEKLQTHYKNHPLILPYNASSIPLSSFPKEEEVVHFYLNTPTSLHSVPLSTVLQWLRQDKAYLNASSAPQEGITWIQKKHGIEIFDMVLIDGSEFSGKAELALIYGAKFILLDDIRAFKNYDNYHKLLDDPNYQLLKENKTLRNGYAIFQRIVNK